MSEEYKKDKKVIIGGALKGTVEELYKVHGPYWNSRFDITKTVLTLTSAVLIGTITFSNFLFGKAYASSIEIMMLKSSWIFFFESICCGIVALWFIYGLNSLSPSLINIKWRISEIIDEQDSSQEFANLDARIDKITERLIDSTITPILDADRRSNIALKAQLILFGCGLLAFLCFGSFAIV